MPSGGRNAKPIEQRELEGNAGHRPVPPVLEVGGRELVEPAHLDAETLDRWRELVRCLGGPKGILATVDAGTIEAAAVNWARARAAGKDITERGILVDGKANPSVRIERDAWAAFRMLADHLGLSPSARARLAAQGIAGGGSVPGAGAGGDDPPAPTGRPKLVVHRGAA